MHFIVDIFTTMLYNLHVVILMNKTILPIGKTPMVQIEYKYKGKILRSKNLSGEDKRELRIILGSMLYPENLSERERQELKLMLDKVKNDKESHSYNILSTVNREDVKFSDSRIIEVLEKMLQG